VVTVYVNGKVNKSEHRKNTMAYTLGEAAKRVGKSKATISKALKTGKISAVKGENGAFQIEAVELHRVYPAVSYKQEEAVQGEQGLPQEKSNELIELRVKLQAAQEQIQDLNEDRELWRKQATNLLSYSSENKAQKSGFFSRLFGSQ